MTRQIFFAPKTHISGAGQRQRAAFLRLSLIWAVLFFVLWPAMNAFATLLDFSTLRLGSGKNIVLVVGGIQGDEPGGFSAASLLATRYEIQEGALWVVPNLNFPSIIKRSRGLHGDMNRKFSKLDSNDPEFATVRKIQELISLPDVKLILNLHDGSGFYRPKYEDKLRNPGRWGQSIIIDQANLDPAIFMHELEQTAGQVANAVNSALIKPLHAVHVHNTNTAAGDREMEKSLSFFAVRQNKAAFGLEASKEFPVAWRAYYHLRMVEKFLELSGLKFTRDFELTPKGVEKALTENLGVSFAENRVFLPLDDARPSIKYLPLPFNCSDRAITSKPIMAVLPCEKNRNELCVHYGNRMVTQIRPEWREVANDLDVVEAEVDGQRVLIPFGQVRDVQDSAIITPVRGYRVNAIGYESGKKDEAGLLLRRRDFDTRYSLDRAGTMFRVEIYKGKAFAGMFLLRFPPVKKSSPIKTVRKNLPATKGPESALGF